MSNITCKFGGSSLADVECILNAAEIIQSDSNRRFIVPSAPGKRNPDDIKITDLLYTWHNLAIQGLDVSQPVDIITARYKELVEGLSIDSFDIGKHINEIAEKAPEYSTPDFMASRGEYLNGRIIAELLGAVFVDPAEYIKFDEEGNLDQNTYELLAEPLKGEGLYVVPGFYGSMPDGTIKTFSRGGSDITGSIVARASNSVIYENWTDVSGFRMTDPSKVPNARRIEEITYKELRELSYMGASVLHDEAIFPVSEVGIPINIRNTKELSNPGTMIVSDRETSHPVCGIAGRKGFTMINIEKTLMNKEHGFGRRVLSVLEEHDISFEHMPTGIDTISLIIKDEELANHGPTVLKAIERTCEPDRVTIIPGLALIATVGKAMNHHIGVAARLCTALAEAEINLRVIDQGSSEMNIIVGVEEQDLNKALKALYDTFEAWE